MPPRNPFSGLFVALVKTAILVPLLSIPLVVFTFLGLPLEVSLPYGVAAYAIAGAIAGRSGTFAWAALAASFLGAFVGYAAFALFVPPMDLLVATIHATVAALASWASALWHMRRLTPDLIIANEKQRRCRLCGSRVGIRATRCWSCRASLNRIT